LPGVAAQILLRIFTNKVPPNGIEIEFRSAAEKRAGFALYAFCSDGWHKLDAPAAPMRALRCKFFEIVPIRRAARIVFDCRMVSDRAMM